MYLIAGIVIGFFAAIPIGPINVYAVSQTLKRDFIHGMLVGITSALLDFIFCFAVLTSMRHLIAQLQAVALHVKGLGSLILLFFALRLILQARKEKFKKEDSRNETLTHHKPVIATMLMYLTNPSLYAFWIAIGGTISAHSIISQSGFNPLLFSGAVFLGTLLWYAILVRYVWKRHYQFTVKIVKRLLYATALILIGLAVYLFVAFL
ncbi:MAG TPA: LysE family transporter [bacterium]|nr:LysE family transporter [bacterium]HPN33470.1 LysE family transporter [bacterium]